jgi:hypothetical protein
MAAQRLKDATRMLQSQIALGKTEVGMTFVSPGFFVVGPLLFVPTGEQSGRAFIGVAKIFPQNAGSIGEVNDVIAKEKIVLDDVPNDSAKKRDIAAGADRHPDICQRARPRKSWIDMDDRRPALFRFHYPAKTDGMRFGHGRAFD